MHQVHGLPGIACFGSTTHAVQPSTLNVCRMNPCQLSTFSSAQEIFVSAATENEVKAIPIPQAQARTFRE